ERAANQRIALPAIGKILEMTEQRSKLKVQEKLQAPTVECLDKSAVGSSNWPLSRRDIMNIARRFNAGTRLPKAQVPKGRLNAQDRHLFGRPFGTRSGLDLDPAPKRWAIVACPCGTMQPIPA